MRIRHGFLVVSLIALVRAAALGAAVVLTGVVAPGTVWAQEAQKGGKPARAIESTALRNAEAEADDAVRRCDANGFRNARNKMIETIDGVIRSLTDRIKELNTQGEGNTEKRRNYTNYRRKLENYRTALRNWNPDFTQCARPESTRGVIPGGGTSQPTQVEPTPETEQPLGRDVRRAADAYFAASAEYLRCESQEKRDRAKANLDAAQRALDKAIEDEVGRSPLVQQAEQAVRSAELNTYMMNQPQFRNYGTAQDRAAAEAKYREAQETQRAVEQRERERIKARIEAGQQTPRQTSCGPGLAPSGVQLAFGGRSTTVNVSTVNAGTQISGGVESPIATSARRLSGGGGFFSVTTPGAGPVKNFFFNVAFDQFSASTSGSVPAGGASVAQTYIFPNPASGSTGILAGVSGQSVSTHTDGRQFDTIVGARQTNALAPINFINVGGGSTSTPVVALEFDAGIRYRNMRRTDSITQQSTTFAGLNSAIDLSATSNFFAPHLGAGIVVMPAGPSGVFGGVRGYVSPGVQTTSATATQNSRCNVCGVGSPETNVTLQRDFSSSKFSVISGAIAYFGYQINPNSKLLFEVAYENQSAAPVFSVPTSPTQQPISLGTGSTDTFKVGGKFLISFAP